MTSGRSQREHYWLPLLFISALLVALPQAAWLSENKNDHELNFISPFFTRLTSKLATETDGSTVSRQFGRRCCVDFGRWICLNCAATSDRISDGTSCSRDKGIRISSAPVKVRISHISRIKSIDYQDTCSFDGPPTSEM